MSGARKNKISWAERVSASLMEEPYSAKRAAAIVTNSPYESEIRKGLEGLREAELIDRETQTAVILAGRDAPRVADALELLHENHILTNKNVAAVSELSHYADLLVEKLLSYHAKSKLTDEQRAAAIQEIKTSRDHAWKKLGKLKEALDFKKIETVVDLANACLELKPFSYDFLKTLDDNDRFSFVCEILKKAAEQGELKKLFKEIVKLDPALLGQMDSKGVFPLVSVVKSADFGAVKLLIECGADSNQTMFGSTVMAFAQHFHEKSNPKFFNQLKTIDVLKNANTEMPKNSNQTEIILTGRALGYPASQKGVCLGCSVMGMQAFLIKGDHPGQHPGLDEFLRRNSKIVELTPEKHLENLINARKKIKEAGSHASASLTENEEIALELPAFFEGIELFQCTTEYKFLYEAEKSPICHSPEPSLGLAASKELERQGGVVSVRRFSGVYNDKEFGDYFEKFEKQASVPIALIIASAEPNHAILVTFDPVTHEFTLVDGLNYLKSSNKEEIVKAVLSRFKVSSLQQIIRTTVFSASENYDKALVCCDNWLAEIKDIQKIIPEKANFRTQKNNKKWLSYAMAQGETELVKKLLNTEYALRGYKGRALFMEQKNDRKFVEETKKINAIRKGRSRH